MTRRGEGKEDQAEKRRRAAPRKQNQAQMWQIGKSWRPESPQLVPAVTLPPRHAFGQAQALGAGCACAVKRCVNRHRFRKAARTGWNRLEPAVPAPPAVPHKERWRLTAPVSLRGAWVRASPLPQALSPSLPGMAAARGGCRRSSPLPLFSTQRLLEAVGFLRKTLL
jgi:hypothetical protein